MIEGLTKMQCGHCGNDGHRLYSKDRGIRKHTAQGIYVECIQCGNQSEITIKQHLSVEWVDGSEGCIHD